MTKEESEVAAKLFKAIDDAITKDPQKVFSAIQTYEEFLRAVELKQKVDGESNEEFMKEMKARWKANQTQS